jgi:hypothetical protein
MNGFLILVATFLGSVNSYLWGFIPLKALSAILPFVISRVNYKIVALLLLSLIYLFNLFIQEGLFNAYELRGLLFYSSIVLFIVFDRYFFKGEGYNLSAKVSNKNMFALLAIFLIIGNFFYITIDSHGFTLNYSYFMNEVERYRGYFPQVIALAIIGQLSKGLSKLILAFIFVIIMFVFTGDRGSSVLFVIISFGFIFLSAKYFSYFLFATEIFIRPLFLFFLKNFENIKGSFLVKAHGFDYLLNNINLLGHGIQPPNQQHLEKIDMYGSYFSPADYAIFGKVYEMGFLSFLISIYFFIIYSKKGFLIQDKTLKFLYLYILSTATIGYGMSSAYYVLISNILILILIFRLKKSRPL